VTANPLLTAPILPTLLRLSLPNMAAMLAIALVAIAETAYVGLLGTPALAGLALVFPMVMLQQMMSAGAMGGGVSSAISRALGVGDEELARALAVHAVAIALLAGLAFTVFFVALGPAIYRLLGGRGAALDESLAYSNVVFLGAAGVWLANTLASVVRGAGDMRAPSAALLAVAVLQIALGGGLGFGLGPLPHLGMAGVALGQVLAYATGALFLLWFLLSGRCRVTLGLRGARLRRDMFADILKVGALACISPMQTVLTILIVTRVIASFGAEALAGYGVGARLEFLLIPVTFAIGVACVPLVGMAIGAGDVARARRIAWTGGGLSTLILGAVGLLVSTWPGLWANLFSTDAAVLAAARSYLTWSGPGYGFFGLGLCLYFASQGAGKVLGPVIAGALRLAIVALGGYWLAATAAPQWTMFALVGFAMAAYGVATALAVHWVPWGAVRARPAYAA
jgi:putative MATE family efflux protein